MTRSSRLTFVFALCSFSLIAKNTLASQPDTPKNESLSLQERSQEPDKAKRPPRTAEERFWSHLKGIPVGPFKLDLGAGLRLRRELQENFNIKQYGEGTRDQFLLERLRVEVGLLASWLRLLSWMSSPRE